MPFVTGNHVTMTSQSQCTLNNNAQTFTIFVTKANNAQMFTIFVTKAYLPKL